MEFKGREIKGTEHIPGHVFVASSVDFAGAIYVPEVVGVYNNLPYEEAEEIRHAVYDAGLDSDADNIAIGNLLIDRDGYSVDYYYSHLCEVMGLEENALEDYDYEKLVELAKKRILEELKIGKLEIKSVTEDKLQTAENYFGNIAENGGVNSDMIIDAIEKELLVQIALMYKDEFVALQNDIINYGNDTALKLAKERGFKGTRGFASILFESYLLTEAEYDKLVGYLDNHDTADGATTGSQNV